MTKKGAAIYWEVISEWPPGATQKLSLQAAPFSHASRRAYMKLYGGRHRFDDTVEKD